MRARASEDWRVAVSSKPGGTRFMGVLALGLGVMLVIAAGGTLLTDWRDWPAAALFVVVGGLFPPGVFTSCVGLASPCSRSTRPA